jgi:hypothetical protein
MAKFGQKKKTLVRIWNDLSWEFRSSAQLCIISAHGPSFPEQPFSVLMCKIMRQEQRVLVVRTWARWSQGSSSSKNLGEVEPRDACLFPKLSSSYGIIEHKNQYNFYPLIPSKYLPGFMRKTTP